MSRTIYVISNRRGAMNEHAVAMRDGLRRHGYNPIIAPKGTVPDKGEFVVCWGWREGQRLRDLGCNVLVMERGYLSDRFLWTSLGWNGLNGRAKWNEPGDNGERFNVHFGHLLRPWHPNPSGYALICGQVPGDAALAGLDLNPWYEQAARHFESRGVEARFRPHPMAANKGQPSEYLRDITCGGDLREALSGAAVAVTWNSNTGCDAVMAGVPVIACDQGSMSWPVAGHGLDAAVITPDRSDWCRRMAWRQWTIREIASGKAWEFARTAMPKSVTENAPEGRTALVIGGAHCVHEDIKAAEALGKFDLVVAVNDIGTVYGGKIDAWCSMHPQKLQRWAKMREDAGFEPSRTLWTAEHLDAAPNFSRVINPGGGSAALATEVALSLGAQKVVLAGCPLESSPHFFDDVPWSPREVEHYRRPWLRHKRDWGSVVRSMSGWTREVYGAPEQAWFDDVLEAAA